MIRTASIELSLQQVVVVGVPLGSVFEHLQGPPEVLLVDVAQGDALPVLHVDQMALQQAPSAAARADHGVADDPVRSFAGSNERAVGQCGSRDA